MNNVVALIETILLVLFAIPVLYLLFLMVAAAFYRRPRLQLANAGSNPEHFIILIPAHNESLTLPATLETIKQLRSGESQPEPKVVVIADNCTDNTAEIARSAGVMVLERHDQTLRGKGHALEWAIAKLMQEYDQSQFSALVIFDADTVPDPDFLQEASYALQCGGQVLQGRYGVLKPNETWRSLLLYTALVIYNHIRPLGRASLGLSDGLRGNGMVFRRAILEQYPWQAFSLVEDLEYATRLALAGVPVTYVPEAQIYGQAASNRKQATTQRMRWEGGRFKQARQDVPPLLRRAVKKGDFNAFDRAMDLIIPPLALLVLMLGAFTVLDTVLCLVLGGDWLSATVIGWLGLLVGIGLFVLGGLLVARAPLSAYLALLFAPFYVLWKMQIYARMLVKRAPQEWTRTPRARIDLSDIQAQADLKKRG
ncbi:MAG TPA: glycosyltransferase family 2 protein [Chloroflexia bacterium]|nr:glycosyltransferase family 2 protein [Chloroflexia bacterium]